MFRVANLFTLDVFDEKKLQSLLPLINHARLGNQWELQHYQQNCMRQVVNLEVHSYLLSILIVLLQTSPNLLWIRSTAVRIISFKLSNKRDHKHWLIFYRPRGWCNSSEVVTFKVVYLNRPHVKRHAAWLRWASLLCRGEWETRAHQQSRCLYLSDVRFWSCTQKIARFNVLPLWSEVDLVARDFATLHDLSSTKIRGRIGTFRNFQLHAPSVQLQFVCRVIAFRPREGLAKISNWMLMASVLEHLSEHSTHSDTTCICFKNKAAV